MASRRSAIISMGRQDACPTFFAASAERSEARRAAEGALAPGQSLAHSSKMSHMLQITDSSKM